MPPDYTMVLKGIFVRTLQKMDSVENTLQLASNSVFDKNKLIVLPLRTLPHPPHTLERANYRWNLPDINIMLTKIRSFDAGPVKCYIWP